MAQIDPSIAMGFKQPQFQDPINQFAKAQELSVNALKMQEMERGVESQNKLRQLYSQGVDVSTPEGFRQLAAVDPASAMKLRTDALQAEKLKGEIKETGLKITAKDMDIAREGYKNLQFNPSDNNFKSFLEDSVLSGKMTPTQAQQQFAEIAPLSIDQRREFIKNRALKAEQLFSDITARRGQDITAGTTMRGQNITDARTREGQRMQYGADVVANTVTDAAGNVTQFNRFGEVIGKPGAIGKPSATFEKTKALREQQSRDLNLLTKELESITKDKGLIDQSTGSGAGRLLDVAAGFVGQSTTGSEAIAKLKPIADMVLKMVPRFEGPQSDKDTASYKEAAGQLADPSVPTATRKAAGKEVLRLMKARKDQFVTESMANEGIGAGGVDTSNPLLK
jgi:hypothetical protein